jgi:hypothetical protein
MKHLNCKGTSLFEIWYRLFCNFSKTVLPTKMIIWFHLSDSICLIIMKFGIGNFHWKLPNILIFSILIHYQNTSLKIQLLPPFSLNHLSECNEIQCSKLTSESSQVNLNKRHFLLLTQHNKFTTAANLPLFLCCILPVSSGRSTFLFQPYDMNLIPYKLYCFNLTDYWFFLFILWSLGHNIQCGCILYQDALLKTLHNSRQVLKHTWFFINIFYIALF